MRTNILKIHDKVFNFLSKQHQSNPDLLFQLRKTDNKGRLSQGFWFRGNLEYMCFTFWSGNDWKERVYPISLIIYSNKSSELQLCAQDPVIDSAAMEELAGILNCHRSGQKKIWNKQFEGTDYIRTITEFIKSDKKTIDDYLLQKAPNGVGFLSPLNFKKQLHAQSQFASVLRTYGDLNKIVKICWNIKGWRAPSGPIGKSTSLEFAYEADNGFGHEEWLLDRSRIVDGYHYAFLQPLSSKSRKHDGKTYHLTLFTNHKNGQYYVGEIKKHSASIVQSLHKSMLCMK